MKRGITWGTLILILFLTAIASADVTNCNLEVSLINQDPYPAIPGDYVKIAFQVDNLGEPECGEVELTLLEQFPISLDPDISPTILIESGFFNEDFDSFLVAPFKVRLDEEALDGENTIEVLLKYEGTKATYKKKFNLTVEDKRADFEISIKDHFPETDLLRFEILNTGKYDVEAVTVELPKQDNIIVKGTNRNIIGSLDSSEDTTFDFEAKPLNGTIELKVIYTDEINNRRTLTKYVEYDYDYFSERKRYEQKTPIGMYITAGIIGLLIIIYIIRKVIKRRIKKKRERRD